MSLLYLGFSALVALSFDAHPDQSQPKITPKDYDKISAHIEKLRQKKALRKAPEPFVRQILISKLN